MHVSGHLISEAFSSFSELGALLPIYPTHQPIHYLQPVLDLILVWSKRIEISHSLLKGTPRRERFLHPQSSGHFPCKKPVLLPPFSHIPGASCEGSSLPHSYPVISWLSELIRSLKLILNLNPLYCTLVLYVSPRSWLHIPLHPSKMAGPCQEWTDLHPHALARAKERATNRYSPGLNTCPAYHGLWNEGNFLKVWVSNSPVKTVPSSQGCCKN